VTCDHYWLWKDDVKLMSELGIKAYRFSIAWTRILPLGEGKISEAGLTFYSNLVDELLANEIMPYATLFHWDLPQTLQDKGGLASRDTVDSFLEYVEVVTSRLGDRVKALDHPRSFR